MSLDALKKHVLAMEQDGKNSASYRAAASFSMLEHIDLMIDRYLREPQSEKGAILLDVFGMLQGLFVAIDALYDLAIGLTQFKYHINVNSNPVLHELKYIRNDIVGHPTNRTYPSGGTGFSMLSAGHLSKEKFSYHTYVFEKNKLDIQTKDVFVKPLLDQYIVEKNRILKDILNYLTHTEAKTNIPENIAILYETLNLESLNKIKDDFIKEYQIDQDSSHRFLWRTSLVEACIFWHEGDVELNQMVEYFAKVQVEKMYEIALDLENRKGMDLYTPLPRILLSFYKFIRKNERYAVELLRNIHDFKHPLRDSDLMALFSLNPPKDAYKLLTFLKDQTDEKKAYMIGSALKAYRPKK